MIAVLAAGAAAGVALIATPLVGRLAVLVGATDRPDGRRVHAGPTPRGGGVAVVVAAAIACVLVPGTLDAVGAGALAGALVVLATGLADDLVTLRPRWKLAGQSVAALLAVADGLRVWPAPADSALALLGPAVTVFWILLVTNAFNLSDGLDGLAAGIALITLGSLAVVGPPGLTPVTAVLVGAVLGFLPYNLHPATIFLGDAGSLVLGYAVAVLPLAAGAGALPPIAILLLVAVPVTDLVLAVTRRFCSRCLRAWGDGLIWRGVLEGLHNTVRPDRRHIHHRLLDLGLSQPAAVVVLYAAAVSMAALAFLAARAEPSPIDLLALGSGLTIVVLVRTLGFDELQPARSGLLLPIVRRLARRGDVLVAADVVFTATAYATALGVTGAVGNAGAAAVGAATAVMVGAEIAALAALGVYRTVWAAAGLNGIALLTRASVAATAGGHVAIRLLGLPASSGASLVHLALIVPAVVLPRIAPVLLMRAARRGGGWERTLICGTDAEARHALGWLRRATEMPLSPIGFVELRPRRQGTRVHRLPVLGTLEALAELLHEHAVRHLVVADRRVRGASLEWVRAVCRHAGVQVYSYSEALVREEAHERTTVADVAAAR